MFILFYKQIYFYIMFFYTDITAKSMVDVDIHYIYHNLIEFLAL